MSKATEFLNEIGDFGYSEKQGLGYFQWKDIKKSILAAHKTSKFSKAKLKTFSQQKVSDGIDVDIGFESDDPRLKSVRARVQVKWSGKDIEINVQTRYNQL
jgi:hypothetical protein